MTEDWLADVRKYAADADEKVVGKLVSYLGIALRNRDSSLVSFSDPAEVGRVKERFLRKKLALSDADSVLDGGLEWVRGLMSADRTKNRVTVYYLLTHYFGKLDVFGGAGGTSAASLGGTAATLGAASLASAAQSSKPETPASANAPVSKPSETLSGDTSSQQPGKADTFSQSAVGTEAMSSTSQQTSTRQSTLRDEAGTAPPAYAADRDDAGDGARLFPRWLMWLLIALAVLALLFFMRSCMADREVATETTADVIAPLDQGMPTPGDNAASTAVASGVVPTGAGVVSGVRDNRPMLSVYFASGESDVSNDMAAAAGTLKAYLDDNPGRTLAVSGYNDPSGNAALNAELSKKRAQAVAAALTASGIPAGAVELVKPADTTTASVTPEQARRVEVTIR
jgi:outer membrane protein OmpA-like peptidoglycan-associated protein